MCYENRTNPLASDSVMQILVGNTGTAYAHGSGSINML